MRFLGLWQTFFALLAVLASEVGFVGKATNPQRLAPDSLIDPVPTTPPMFFFSCAMFFFQTIVRSRGVLMLLFLFAVTTPHHRCSVAYMA